MTTEFSDWATDCPEYKVTAVQVRRTSHPVALPGPVRGDAARDHEDGRRRGRGGSTHRAVKPETMVHRANQIALFFASYSREEAVAGVADHLVKFWEPRMRRQLAEYVAADGAGLHDLVRAAVEKVEAAADQRVR